MIKELSGRDILFLSFYCGFILILSYTEVMKRHLWMKKKKSRIMVRNLKSKQQLKTKITIEWKLFGKKWIT